MMVGSRRSEREPMLRGVLFTLRRKCGKPNCRCVGGDLHESPALAYPDGGRTKTMTLTDADVPAVREALERYRIAREGLDSAADAEIAAMRALHAARRRQPRA